MEVKIQVYLSEINETDEPVADEYVAKESQEDINDERKSVISQVNSVRCRDKVVASHRYLGNDETEQNVQYYDNENSMFDSEVHNNFHANENYGEFETTLIKDNELPSRKMSVQVKSSNQSPARKSLGNNMFINYQNSEVKTKPSRYSMGMRVDSGMIQKHDIEETDLGHDVDDSSPQLTEKLKLIDDDEFAEEDIQINEEAGYKKPSIPLMYLQVDLEDKKAQLNDPKMREQFLKKYYGNKELALWTKEQQQIAKDWLDSLKQPDTTQHDDISKKLNGKQTISPNSSFANTTKTQNGGANEVLIYQFIQSQFQESGHQKLVPKKFKN